MNYSNFPNITWPQFKVCNDDYRTEFENMCRQLFTYEFLNGKCFPHSNPNNPGIEGEPVLEPARSDNQPQKKIGFQAKFFEAKIDYQQIKKSAKEIVKYYKEKLDVVYLFCNCKVSTCARGYRSIERLLADAGVKLCPISDTELLDLVRKYPAVANYYFRNRDRANDLSSFSGKKLVSPDFSATSNSLTCTEDVPTTEQPSQSNNILTVLYRDKIEGFRNDILELRLNNLDSKIQTLLPDNESSIDGMDTLMFYHFLLTVYSRNSIETAAIREKLVPKYYNDAEWILDHWSNSKAVPILEFVRLFPETQVILLNKMFEDQSWSDIIDLNQKAEQAKGVLDDCVNKQLQLLCALSLFNQQKYDIACEKLDELYTQYHTDKIEFFRVCAHIQKINSEFIYGNNKCHFDLVDYLKAFDDVKNRATDYFNQNMILVANLEVVSYRNLSEGNAEQLKQVFERYANYPENIRNNPVVKFQIALCYEMVADFEQALSVYSSLEDQNDESVRAREASCNIQLKRYEEAVCLYSDVDISTLSPRAQGEYLLALSYGNADEYRRFLDVTIDQNRLNIIDLFYIAYYVRDEQLFCEKIVPVLQAILRQDVDSFLQTSMTERNGYLLILAHFNQIELIKVILDSVCDISSIDAFVVSEIYNSLFKKLNGYIEKTASDRVSFTQIYMADKIADCFLRYKPSDTNYIQIKMMCARLSHMSVSELKFAKQLFESNPSKFLASRIIQLLQEQRETPSAEYDRYLGMFKESDNAEDAIYVAQLSAQLGRESDAKLYLYKAFYKLNGIDNYMVYSHALCTVYMVPEIFNTGTSNRKIAGSSIVILEPEDQTENTSQPNLMKICLDSEKDFSDVNNKSLGMQHFAKDSNYVPTLSTLILLCLLDHFDILDGIKEQLIIPESYLNFLNTQYAKAVQVQKNSGGNLVFVDDKLALVEPDEQLPLIWEKILDFCSDLPRENISDDERMEQGFIEGCTLEKLIAVFRSENIQLDSFILAKRQNAIYLCDDLFFRNIAQMLGIQSINFASLLRCVVEKEKAEEIIVKLSETNYIYLPLDIISDERIAKKVVENLLHGKRKGKCYGACFYIFSLLMNDGGITDR